MPRDDGDTDDADAEIDPGHDERNVGRDEEDVEGDEEDIEEDETHSPVIDVAKESEGETADPDDRERTDPPAGDGSGGGDGR